MRVPRSAIWPILIWSAIGNREIHNNVQQIDVLLCIPAVTTTPRTMAGWIYRHLAGQHRRHHPLYSGR